MAVGWARGLRDSAHGTWISRRARSWRRACCCRRAAAGNPTHVRGMACGGDMERSVMVAPCSSCTAPLLHCCTRIRCFCSSNARL